MLQVVICGAGISGLAAATSLRRAGHIVHVYERSSMNNEIGAAINVPPNATRFLEAWGLDAQRWRFVKPKEMTWKDPFTLETKLVTAREDTARSIGGSDLYYAHRVDLHNALKWMATRPDGPGTPATIHLNSAVVAYDPDEPSVTLASGDKIISDLVIGADGVHSTAAEAVVGRKNEPVAPAHANYCYRFLIPAETVEEDPETRDWNKDMDGRLRLFPDNNTRRRIIMYPCRDNTIHNFVAIFYDDARQETAENWQATADVSEVLERYSDFHPDLLKLISKATEVKRWPLLYRHPIPKWYRGRMALAGDSAHPMLPNQAQAGAQGLEDGLAIGITLVGASSDDIPRRLEVYDQIRRNRASAIQILSNVGQDQTHLVKDELLQYMTEKEIPTKVAESWRYTYGFDVVRASVKAMKQHDPSFEMPGDFFEHEVVGVPDQ